MGSFSIFHWIIVLFIVGIPLLLIALVVGVLKPQQNELANTWKFRTVIFIILALVLSFALVTVPLFLYLAYRSYVAGSTPSQSIPSPNRTDQIERLHALLSSSALTQAEYEIEKKKVLGA